MNFYSCNLGVPDTKYLLKVLFKGSLCYFTHACIHAHKHTHIHTYSLLGISCLQFFGIWSTIQLAPNNPSALYWLFHLKSLFEEFMKHHENVMDRPTFFSSQSQFSSVQFSHSVVSDSLGPHESQHTRPPCPSPTSGVHSDSHPSSQWCHPAISSSVVTFCSCPQSLPASESFPMSQLFTWGGQSTGVSALA